MEVRELNRFRSDLTVWIGDLGTDEAYGGLESRDGGPNGGERGFGILDGRELREKIVVTRQDFGTELLL